MPIKFKKHVCDGLHTIAALHPTNSNRRDSKRDEHKRTISQCSNGDTTTIEGFQDCANFRRRSMYL